MYVELSYSGYVNTSLFGILVFVCKKLVLNRFSVLLTFIKMYYYTKQINLCTMHCNIHGGTLVESIAFNRRVVGSTPALATM